jgi:SAM-dependent methyltransferase
MPTRPRTVLPELLDHLVPDDPSAIRSRRDLQRIHVFMRTLSTLRRALLRLQFSRPPGSILELGAGDGTLLLRLARTLAGRWPDVEVTLLDQHDLVSQKSLDAYRELGWRVSVVTSDILRWAREPLRLHFDLCITTLFLHHFSEGELADILAAVAARSDAFLACEPRRDAWTLFGSRLVGLMGGNHVTRADARSSVAAGFSGHDLTRSWPQIPNRWALSEARVFPFTHLFSAQALQVMPAGVSS